MATAFDGIGMGQLGKESQYYSGTNPFREAMKGLKDFTIISGIEKSGLREFLNDWTKNKGVDKSISPADNGYSAARDAAIPPTTTTYDSANQNLPAQMPLVQEPVLQNNVPLQNQAERAFGIQSFLTPDPLKPRDPGMDQVAIQMASAPTPQLNLPKYGKQPGGSGGLDPATILSIAKFFI